VGEDHALVSALRELGAPVVHAHDMKVSTSARLSTRVSRGFSDYLTGLIPSSETERTGDTVTD